MNLHFLVAFLVQGLLATAASSEVTGVGGGLAARDNSEPLTRWIPLQQAEPALGEKRLIRGLLNVRQSDCNGLFTCGTG